MIGIEDHLSRRKRGSLDGHFLVAMPGMNDERFERTVIFVCAHSEDGAMGFILNRPQPVLFHELLEKLDLDNHPKSSRRPKTKGNDCAPDFPIQLGGPLDAGRGFVLHSDDYMSQSTMPVNDELCLTATVDILRAIKEGVGPRRGIMLLGYAGWGPGQLEDEMSGNAWLSTPATDDIVFDPDHSGKYDRVLATMGIAPAMLSTQTGHA
ncbi:putative transcriptional regulator [Hoeflea sp. IMCC20628]|uniref:YqgE/AlgH family protein n=1 Tax=Hoeflea sp. IMCC20628 TaxID=1620421 RepID=UPI00063A8E1F|nr:YqgE/AlgH family protein [Hoeflea sp. IMCC20628]AKI01473.1 putative transcriptional regulator [Hoeflea sp. IMCC20628]